LSFGPFVLVVLFVVVFRDSARGQSVKKLAIQDLTPLTARPAAEAVGNAVIGIANRRDDSGGVSEAFLFAGR
jgi:hypothetical protein